MTSSESHSETPAGDEKEAPQPPSFGNLAKRIRSRTTDLLAIAVILVGGFAVGSQVSRLWEEEPNPVPAGQTTAGPTLFDPNEPVELDFGDSPFSIQRAVFNGAREDASVELVAKCRKAAAAASGPKHAITAGERRLLRTLAKANPVAEQDGRKLYRINGPIIMASVTGRVAAGVDSKHADATTRVICWGLAFPIAEKRWMTYVFTPRSEAGATSRFVEIPLPPSATPVLTIRGGHGMTRSFRSTESADSVTAFFKNWLNANSWSRLRMDNSQSTLNFERFKNGTSFRIEIQINSIDGNTSSGMLILTSNSKQK